jgi:hypothetical protein
MPVSLSDRVATLTGRVSVDDAEPLAAWLRATADPSVLMSGCTQLHTAALQALLAAGGVVDDPPTEPFLARWVAPMIIRPQDGGPEQDAVTGQETP